MPLRSLDIPTLAVGAVLTITVASWWHQRQERQIQLGLVSWLAERGYTACQVTQVELPLSTLVDRTHRGQAVIQRDTDARSSAGIELQIDGRLTGTRPPQLQLGRPAEATLNQLGC